MKHSSVVFASALLTASPAAAAPQLAPATAAPPAPASRPTGPGAGEPYWFKTYSTAPYAEIWTGDLALKHFARDLPKIVKAIENNGGALTQPLANFVSSQKDQTQQLSFSLPRDRAQALLKAFRTMGDMAEPAVRPMGTPIPIKEVRAKIDVMMKEKTDHGAELARVPAAAAAEEEILEHLLLVEELSSRAVSELRFNLLVRQK
ncbi:MAG: hypothetical protein ACHQ49_12770 [Elusimicrobiota bacterium]